MAHTGRKTESRKVTEQSCSKHGLRPTAEPRGFFEEHRFLENLHDDLQFLPLVRGANITSDLRDRSEFCLRTDVTGKRYAASSIFIRPNF